jgi:hypothetical protein
MLEWLLSWNSEGPWWITAAALLLYYVLILAAIGLLIACVLSRAGLW